MTIRTLKVTRCRKLGAFSDDLPVHFGIQEVSFSQVVEQAGHLQCQFCVGYISDKNANIKVICRKYLAEISQLAGKFLCLWAGKLIRRFLVSVLQMIWDALTLSRRTFLECLIS